MVCPSSSVDQLSVSLLTSKATFRILSDGGAWNWGVVPDFLVVFNREIVVEFILASFDCIIEPPVSSSSVTITKTFERILVIQLVSYIERSHFTFQSTTST